jgi:chromate transporter
MYGLPGAITSVVAVIVPTALGSAAVTFWFEKLQPVIKLISLPAGFVIAGMIAAAAWQLAKPMQLSASELVGVCVVTLLIAWRNLSPVLVILGSACVGFLLWLVGT